LWLLLKIFLCAKRLCPYLYPMHYLHNLGLIGLFTAVFFVAIACGGTSEGADAQAQESIVPIKDTTRYGVEPFQFPELSAQAETIIEDWPVFKDFKRISLNLQNVAVEDLKFRSKNLLVQTDSLAASLPEILDSPIITARLLVIQTRLQLLHQETKKGTPKTQELETHLTNLRLSIEEFVLHVNEKLEKDALDKNRRNKE
jgi:hypothetical protein